MPLSAPVAREKQHTRTIVIDGYKRADGSMYEHGGPSNHDRYYKGASDTPWAVRLLAELLRDAGYPPGVFNMVAGSGAVVGNALIDDPRIAGVTFTGSYEVGMDLSRRMAAGEAVKIPARNLAPSPPPSRKSRPKAGRSIPAATSESHRVKR